MAAMRTDVLRLGVVLACTSAGACAALLGIDDVGYVTPTEGGLTEGGLTEGGLAEGGPQDAGADSPKADAPYAHACLGPAPPDSGCTQNGSCDSTLLHSQESQIFAMAVDDTYVYWLANPPDPNDAGLPGAVSRIRKDKSSGAETVAKAPTPLTDGAEIVTDGSNVYFIGVVSSWDSTIYAASKESCRGCTADIVFHSGGVTRMGILGEAALFELDVASHYITRAGDGGWTVTKVRDIDPGWATAVATDDSFAYYTDNGADKTSVRRYSPKGSDVAFTTDGKATGYWRWTATPYGWCAAPRIFAAMGAMAAVRLSQPGSIPIDMPTTWPWTVPSCISSTWPTGSGDTTRRPAFS